MKRPWLRPPAGGLVIAVLLTVMALAPAVAARGGTPPLDTGSGPVADGGFEAPQRVSPWRFETRGDRDLRGREHARGGDGAARLCGEPGCRDRLSQELDPPSPGGGSLLLLFHLRLDTAKQPGAACQDDLLVRVTVGAAAPQTVGRTCEEAATDVFAEHRLDLTPLARRAADTGERLTLRFEANTDAAAATTTFWLDDVALVSDPTPPGPANARVSGDEFSASSEPHVAVDPADPDRFVGAAKVFTGNATYRFRVATFASADGGRTWRDNGLLPGLDAYDVVSDPVVAFGPDGAAYVAVVGATIDAPTIRAADGWDIFVYRSTDGGRSFTGPVAVDVGQADDKPWLAVDRSAGPTRGTVYVVWTDGCTTYLGRSVGGTRPFSPRQRLMDACAGAQVAVGPDGAVYVAAPSRFPFDEPYSLLLAVSRDGGATFSPTASVLRVRPMPSVLDGGFRAGALPQLAVAPDTGDLLVAWNDARDGTPDVWLSRSVDGGATFSAPLRVNDGSANDQFQPALAAGDDGTVVLAWFDRRADPTNRLAEFRLARSTDGGATFGPSIPVSTQRFDPALAAPRDLSGRLFFGDYQGLALTADTAIPFWNDPRSGLQHIYAARISLATLPT